MPLLHLPYIAAIFGLDGPLFSLLMSGAAMCFAATITISALYFKHQRQKLWHETARIALEKGQPVPPMPSGRNNVQLNLRSETNDNHDLRAGLILVGVGFGIFLFFNAVAGRQVGYLGAIPGFIGVALLLHRLLTALFVSKKPDPTRPPQ